MSEFIRWLLRQIFAISLGSYIFFVFVEEFRKGMVSSYFSLNWLLVLVLIFGLITFRLPPQVANKDALPPKRPMPLLVLSSFFTMILVWFGASDFLLSWRLLLSIYAGFVTFTILFILFEE